LAHLCETKNTDNKPAKEHQESTILNLMQTIPHAALGFCHWRAALQWSSSKIARDREINTSWTLDGWRLHEIPQTIITDPARKDTSNKHWTRFRTCRRKSLEITNNSKCIQ